MLNLPFFSELEKAQNILIAGAGGGFDIFAGLPLYFGLKSEGKEVHLASLSFSYLSHVEEDRSSPSMLEVTAHTKQYSDYFPEKYLSEWFRQKEGHSIPIYCFERTGVKPLLASYQRLITELSLDTIILVDGGTDSLMKGDEDGLGTPQEDIASITVVNELEVERKLLACLGFGVDHFHEVSNFLSLEAIAALTKTNGFLGMFSLLEGMPEVKMYREATEYVFSQMPKQISIVSSSILASLAGQYGDYHTTSRTKGSKLWINPLMSTYLCFDVERVAERILYLDEMKKTEHYHDIQQVIGSFRRKYKDNIRWRESIPD